MLVKDIGDSPVDRALVCATYKISQVMDRQTVAEFAETADIVRGIDVNYAQGFDVERPIPLTR